MELGEGLVFSKFYRKRDLQKGNKPRDVYFPEAEGGEQATASNEAIGATLDEV